MAEADAEAVDEIARLAAVRVDEESADSVLSRVVRLTIRRCSSCDAAAVTVHTPAEHTFAASDERIHAIHQTQFDSAAGPVIDVLDLGEPRRVDDVASDPRWPAFNRAAEAAGFRSCLVLPVRTDRSRSGALALYSRQDTAFTGSAHDLALLLAAQTGVAVDNHVVLAGARRTVENLQRALQTAAVIEQAKAIIAADNHVSLDEAFQLLSHESQRQRQKLYDVAREFVAGRIRSA